MSDLLLERYLLWGTLGLLGEIIYTSIYDLINKRDVRLKGTTYLWMFPIYGLIAVLYEPTHDYIRDQFILVRAAIWSVGFTTIELITGWLLQKTTGKCPWDYQAAGARFAINPYIRADYFPLWAAIGLLLEPIHNYIDKVLPKVLPLL